MSDNCDSYFALQGIPWMMRKIMRVTSPEVGALASWVLFHCRLRCRRVAC